MPEAATSFLNLKKSSIAEAISTLGEPRFRARQIEEWLFDKREFRVESMTNLSKPLREKLWKTYDWSLPEIISRLEAEDGSTKLLLKSTTGHVMETVILRYEKRTSLCVSSQVGCRLACSFCQTGKLGFVRHLSMAEILQQFAVAQDILKPEDKRISHVVFMGMGEPLDNYDAAVGAANTLIDDFGMAARQVTISTSGLVPGILRMAEESRAALAVSLHAASDGLRTELMPINRRYDLAKLKDALKTYQAKTNRKITFEYILIKDKNSSVKAAKDLVRFVHGIRAKINLIPFNPHPGLPYQRPTSDEIRQFQKYLADRSYPAPVRYSKGLEVSAACGQLAAKVADSLQVKPSRSSIAQIPH